VTIRADDLAFRDLGENVIPKGTLVHKGADVQALVSQVVELEHRWIAFTAIDARVVEEVHEQKAPIALAHPLLSYVDPLPTLIAVRRVIADHLLDVAFAAVILAAVFPRLIAVEVSERLHGATARAALARLGSANWFEQPIHRHCPSSAR
jgi:hypothetical protein